MARSKDEKFKASSGVVSLDTMLRQMVDVGVAVLDGDLALTKAAQAIRASAVAAKWHELRLKYGEGANAVLTK